MPLKNLLIRGDESSDCRSGKHAAYQVCIGFLEPLMEHAVNFEKHLFLQASVGSYLTDSCAYGTINQNGYN